MIHHLEQATSTPRTSRLKSIAIGVLAATIVVGSVAPSFAIPAMREVRTLVGDTKGNVEKTTYRRYHHNGPRNHGVIRSGPAWGYGAAAAGVGAAGLAAGALMDQAAGVEVDQIDGAVSYCADRFRSYDPTTGTYLGYDGREHGCP